MKPGFEACLQGARERLGVLLFDWLRYRRAIRSRGDAWLSLCNRAETLRPAPQGAGLECVWRWSSDLHAPKVFPRLGQDLMRRALESCPVRLASAPSFPASEKPDVAVIIGHRGEERLPLLLMTLRSLAAQSDAALECVVVEHVAAPSIAGRLPPGVHHVPLPAVPGEPYNRAKTFNAGMRQVRAPVAILHDGDILAPATYARDALNLFRQGEEIVNLKRFVFCLSAEHTAQTVAQGTVRASCAPESVVQNLTGGGSLAVSRAAYERIGGFDEAFEGWGGEDVDFWDRAQTRRVWPYAHLPFFHLWHAPQPEKTPAKDAPAMQRLAAVSRIPVEERIARLRHR